jgi:hypothetical protein
VRGVTHTCRPYRAEGLNGFQAINISRQWRFGPQQTNVKHTRDLWVREHRDVNGRAEVDRLVLKTIAAGSPKAQISGGKAAGH